MKRRKTNNDPNQILITSFLKKNTNSTASSPRRSSLAPIQVAPIQVAPIQVAPIQVAPIQVAPIQVAPMPNSTSNYEIPTPDNRLRNLSISIKFTTPEQLKNFTQTGNVSVFAQSLQTSIERYGQERAGIQAAGLPYLPTYISQVSNFTLHQTAASTMEEFVTFTPTADYPTYPDALAALPTFSSAVDMDTEEDASAAPTDTDTEEDASAAPDESAIGHSNLNSPIHPQNSTDINSDDDDEWMSNDLDLAWVCERCLSGERHENHNI